jgi:ABC-type branched-subunit amino acid transport system ATPase component
MALLELRDVIRHFSALIVVDDVSLSLKAGDWQQHITPASHYRKHRMKT